MLNFFNINAIDTISFTFVPFKVLNRLFWTNCIALNSETSGFEFSIRTLPRYKNTAALSSWYWRNKNFLFSFNLILRLNSFSEKWNVTTLIRRGSKFYFFTYLYWTHIGLNARFALPTLGGRLKKGHLDQIGQ